MNYTLTSTDRGYNISFYDGFISAITAFSGAPYSARHWDLSITCKPEHRFGHRVIAAVQFIPVVGALAGLIERIVVYAYNRFFEIKHTKPTFDLVSSNSNSKRLQSANYVNPLLPIDVPSYEALKEKMGQKNATLYVSDETGKHQENLLGILGTGGSKKAIHLSKGRALILPNMDSKPPSVVAENWERIVLEEVAMSKILNKIGLLSPLSERVNITLSESSEQIIPAYISRSFKSLAETEECFIIDMKNKYSSTWNRFLFKSDEERLNEKNWDSVLDSLATDVAKICMHHIPINFDSRNIAIVKKSSESTLCQYEVRYFGFDFSSKDEFLALPEIQEKPSGLSDLKWPTSLFDQILDHVFFLEFGSNRYGFGLDKDKLKSFKNQLVLKYTNTITSRTSI